MAGPADVGEAISKAIAQLQSLQQAFANNAGASKDPQTAAKLQEAITDQLTVISSLQQSMVPAAAATGVKNAAGAAGAANANRGDAENVDANLLLAPVVFDQPGTTANNTNIARSKDGADGGYTFPMFFGSPKEQRTPDAQPAQHASHHTILVAARQQRSKIHTARPEDGTEKKLTFLLPETPVDAAKYTDAVHVGSAGNAADAAAADALASVASISAKMTAATADLTATTTPGGAGKSRPINTPGKVASTPMAIEVLSQLFNNAQQQQQQQQQKHAPQPFEARETANPGVAALRAGAEGRVEFRIAAAADDRDASADVEALGALGAAGAIAEAGAVGEIGAMGAMGAMGAVDAMESLDAVEGLDAADDEDYAYGDDSPAPRRAARAGTKTHKPRRKQNRPRSTVKEKAARAASLAVSRPKKSAAEVGKSCNCKKSQCLKMYCDCFAASGYCHPSCTCESCKNTDENEDVVNVARAGILMKEPTAFDEKIDVQGGAHRRGCRCKRSKCLKKYCECYSAGVACNESCQCVGCANCEGDAPAINDPVAAELVAAEPMSTAAPVAPVEPVAAKKKKTPRSRQINVPTIEYPTVPSVEAARAAVAQAVQPVAQATAVPAVPAVPVVSAVPAVQQLDTMTPQQMQMQMQVAYQVVSVPVQMPDGSTQMVTVNVPMQLNATNMQALQVPAGESPGSAASLKVSVDKVAATGGSNSGGSGNVASQQFAPSQQFPTQQYPSQPQDDPTDAHPHPSHVQSQTPVTDSEGPSPAIPAAGGSKARRMTNISAGTKGGNASDWRKYSTAKTPSGAGAKPATDLTSVPDTEKENKRPRRAASSGVAAAAAAAKHGVSHERFGFEKKWDTITPPCRVRRKRGSKNADPLAPFNGTLTGDGFGGKFVSNSQKDIFAPFCGNPNATDLSGNPKKAEAKFELMKALQKQQARRAKEEEADAAELLFSLAQ